MGCTELLALLGVGQGPLEGAFGDAERLGGDADAAAVQGVHGDLEALPFLAEQVLHRDAQVVEGKGGGVAAADPHLVFVLEDRHTRRLQVDDKGADPLVLQDLVGGGQEDAGPQIAAVGDEDLAAVDDELVAFPLVHGGNATGVAAGVRFGQEEAADRVAGVQGGQPLFLLLLGAEGVDRAAAKRGVGRDKYAAGTAGLGNLFDDDGVGEHVETGPAVLFRKVAAEKAHLPHFRNQRVGDHVLFVDLHGNRLDLLFDEITHADCNTL